MKKKETSVDRIMREENCGRTKAFAILRQRKESEQPAEPALELTTVEPTDTGGVAWARAVMWASDNVGTKMTRRKAGNQTNYSMWKFGQDDPRALQTQLVPRALQILDKNAATGGANGSGMTQQQIDVETAEISELVSLLESAVAESNAGACPTCGR